jgi:hypothetical protein
MRILLYSPYPLDNNGMPLLLDEAVEYLRDPRNDVLCVTCDGELRPCLTNAEQSRIRCLECRFSTALLRHKTRDRRLVYRALSSYADMSASIEVDSREFVYSSLRDVRAIEHSGVNIGLGVVSSYASMTRNLNPALNRWNRQFLDDSLRASARLVIMASRIFDEYKPDLVCLFNGRYVGLRPVLDLALKRNIPTKVLEHTFSTSREEVRKVEFLDSLPQDVEKITPIIEANWIQWTGERDKERVAADFFERRRNGATASDTAYTRNQSRELLPRDWDSARRNFVIFNSSEDEFFAIGDAFEKHRFFDDQLEGIRYLAQRTASDPSIHLFLRVHPNLAGIPYRYHSSLASLSEQFANITVIGADSPISTYKLIAACEKVFVFGSTAGVEAAYWGKPVVLLGAALYQGLDVAYRPRTREELDSLTFSVLEPKQRLGCLKYALFLFGERGTPFRHVNFNNVAITLNGKMLLIPRCYEYWGSMTPYLATAALFRVLNGISHLVFKRITMKKLGVESGPAEGIRPT